MTSRRICQVQFPFRCEDRSKIPDDLLEGLIEGTVELESEQGFCHSPGRCNSCVELTLHKSENKKTHTNKRPYFVRCWRTIRGIQHLGGYLCHLLLAGEKRHAGHVQHFALPESRCALSAHGAIGSPFLLLLFGGRECLQLVMLPNDSRRFRYHLETRSPCKSPWTPKSNGFL